MKVYMVPQPIQKLQKTNPPPNLILAFFVSLFNWITWIAPVFLCGLIIWKGIDVSLASNYPPHYGCVITLGGLFGVLYQLYYII